MAETRIIEAPVRYEIVGELAQGGMGIVYEARQHGARGFSKRIALKVIRETYARREDFLQNFIGEAKLVADLIHTNIVQTYQLGEADGLCFIAMELIRGVNLNQFLRELEVQGRELPVELAVFIVSRVARGLAYAHAKTDAEGRSLGIVHRDVNPKNVMIGFEGDVKLTDFGIAKARGFLRHEEGEVALGKADYMSPEQADFQITDARSDLFSAGVVLAHLLLGRNIFRGATPEESLDRVRHLPIPRFAQLSPRVNSRLERILNSALHRDPAQRYQRAEDLLHDLEYSIYHSGYGPTSDTLGKFVRSLFAHGRNTPERDVPHATVVYERVRRRSERG
jgi:serine/threonine-protein kinase